MKTLNVRIDKDVKKKATETLAAIGLDMSSAVKLFLNQVIIDEGLPFTPSRRAKEIRARWDSEVTDTLKHGKSYKTARVMLKEIAH